MHNMNLPKLEPHPHELPSAEFGTKVGLLSELGQSNEPIAVMVTCWELGGIPDQVSHASPGEIMVVQCPGGLVAAPDTESNKLDLHSVLYYLQQPSVRHLIVCGHSQCTTLAVLLDDETKSTMDAYRHLIEDVLRRFQSTYIKRPESDWLQIIAQESVLQQLANLRSHKQIQSRLDAGSLFLHGWIREDQTSAIAAFDTNSGQYSA